LVNTGTCGHILLIEALYISPVLHLPLVTPEDVAVVYVPKIDPSVNLIYYERSSYETVTSIAFAVLHDADKISEEVSIMYTGVSLPMIEIKVLPGTAN